MPPFNPLPAGSSAAAESRAGLRFEWALVLAVMLLGLGLRSLRPEAMAIEHFDEGVYASNLDCGHLDPPFAYPMRHLYAPPLFPALLEWAQIVAGPAAVMWVNVLLGSVTVAAVWWTTRCWFGPAAALAAAMLAATSEYHIAFSRMALTDVPLSLFMLLGVFAGWKAILHGRPLWILAAGLLAGLAWCTKYNGWLTLAVTGAGTAGCVLATALGSRGAGTDGSNKIANCKLGVAGVRWGLTAAIAGVTFWVFVLRELAPVGGYAAVAKNHAGYFVGPGGWWSGFVRQAAAHDLLMGWPTCAGIAIATVLAVSGDRQRPEFGRCARMVLIAIAFALLARLLTVSGWLAISAPAGSAVVLRQSAAAGDKSDSMRLAGWMLLAWFVGLLVATPLYFPYPRLSLPWVVVCWPLAGAAIAAIVEQRHCVPSPSESKIENQKSKIAAAAACIALAGAVWFAGRGATSFGCPPAWQPRSLAAGIARVMLIEIETAAARTGRPGAADVEAVVYVQGDPATFYQLASLCRSRPIVVLPVAEATGLRPTNGTPTFLVTHETAGVVPPKPASAELVQSYEYRSSDLVLLDRMSGTAVRSALERPTDVLRLDMVRGQ